MAAPPSESTDIAVIGAGVMGTSVAYHLALRGERVLLLDKLGAAGGPSGASAGMLRAHYEDPAIVAVARYGCEFLADMLERTGSDPGFVNCGYLAVGEADREPRILRAIEAMRSQGAVVEQLDNAQIRSLEPRLAADALTIGAYEPTNGVCEPLFVADGFARAAERLGARLSFGVRVTAVRPDGEGFRLICADGRHISAARVAVCCGGFGPRLTRSLGGSLPVDLVRVQAGRFRPPFPFGPPGPIVSHHTLGVWLRPDGDDGHYLVGARADFLGRGPYRARSGQGGADQRELDRLADLVASRLPRRSARHLPRLLGQLARLHPRRQPGRRPRPPPPGPAARKRHVGPRLQALPSARPGSRRAPAGRRSTKLRLVAVPLRPLRPSQGGSPRQRGYGHRASSR